MSSCSRFYEPTIERPGCVLTCRFPRHDGYGFQYSSSRMLFPITGSSYLGSLRNKVTLPLFFYGRRQVGSYNYPRRSGYIARCISLVITPLKLMLCGARDLSDGREITRSCFVDAVQGITYPDDDHST